MSTLRLVRSMEADVILYAETARTILKYLHVLNSLRHKPHAPDLVAAIYLLTKALKEES